MHEHVRQTALYEQHVRLKAKMVPFGGWMMPISYPDGVLKEHHRVRSHAGLFDVSHMGEIVVAGQEAMAFLQYLTINDVSRLPVGGGQYSALCTPDGGMIDDLILYRCAESEYFLCVNAANSAKDYAWIKSKAATFSQVQVRDESALWSQLAIQGPHSLQAIHSLIGDAATQSRVQALPYTHILELEIFGLPCRLARTGYTGEKGYELYLPHAIVVQAWQTLLATAPSTGIVPIGLGARDTLRLEACYLLYGNDMDENVSPLEVGIGWATKLDGEDFIGRAALVAQKEQGVPRKMVAFQMEEQAIPRHGMDVYSSQGERLGQVSSGSVLPTVGGAGGLALVSSQGVKVNDLVTIDVRGKHKKARIIKRPLYNAKVRD